MANQKVTIRWNTKCPWNGQDQPVVRKNIDPPRPATLSVGQKVHVKFSSRWYDANVMTPWVSKQKSKWSTLLSCENQYRSGNKQYATKYSKKRQTLKMNFSSFSAWGSPPLWNSKGTCFYACRTSYDIAWANFNH